jgi:hypothetical protein
MRQRRSDNAESSPAAADDLCCNATPNGMRRNPGEMRAMRAPHPTKFPQRNMEARNLPLQVVMKTFTLAPVRAMKTFTLGQSWGLIPS